MPGSYLRVTFLIYNKKIEFVMPPSIDRYNKHKSPPFNGTHCFPTEKWWNLSWISVNIFIKTHTFRCVWLSQTLLKVQRSEWKKCVMFPWWLRTLPLRRLFQLKPWFQQNDNYCDLKMNNQILGDETLFYFCALQVKKKALKKEQLLLFASKAL